MTELTQNVPLNIYEPEVSLKIYKNTKKKSIITKIIKNPEIAPAHKKINIKYNDIKENSMHLNEYNIFRRPGERIFRLMQNRINNNMYKKGNNNKSDNSRKYIKNKNKNFIISRKQLEKLNKNIPNNLYDYLHPYEYRYYSKNNDLLKNYIKMQTKSQKEIKDIKSSDNKEIKILKLNDDIKANTDKTLIRYKSNNLITLKSNLEKESNDKLLFFSSSTKNKKILPNNINKLNSMLKHNIETKHKRKLKKKRLKQSQQIYENYSDEYSSSLSFTEKINNSKLNTETNFKKRLFINGNEISNYNKLFYYNTLSAKLKNNYLMKPKIKMVRYNQKVFNRNNKILIPYEEIKKIVFNSDSETPEKKWVKYKNFLKLSENFEQIYDKKQKEKIIKDVGELIEDLNELKFYMISDKIDREKYKKKLEELEKKMNYREDKVMIMKDILFEKFNNSDNQNDYINHAVNKNQYVNKLISSYVNYNEKKNDGILDKKFMGGLKKLNYFGMQDAVIRNVIGESNYFIKHSINKIEEAEICKDRKHLGDNMKKIKQMIKIIYNKKKNIGKENI